MQSGSAARSRLPTLAAKHPKLVDGLPTLARDLRESLLREGEADLAAQLDEATIHALCGCDDEDCFGVYLAPEREPSTGLYRAILPDAVLSVGVCWERIDWIDDRDWGSGDAHPQRRKEYEALRPHVPTRLP